MTTTGWQFGGFRSHPAVERVGQIAGVFDVEARLVAHGLVPEWTPEDEANLARRIRRIEERRQARSQ